MAHLAERVPMQHHKDNLGPSPRIFQSITTDNYEVYDIYRAKRLPIQEEVELINERDQKGLHSYMHTCQPRDNPTVTSLSK